MAITAETFKGNTKITGVEIPDTVTSIADHAFEGCISLSQVKMSPYTTHIGSYAFADCIALASVELPENLISIADHAFYSSGITELVIPEKVTSVGDYAFGYCTDLSYLRINASITEVGEYIFFLDNNLHTVYIGERVTYVEPYYIFDMCDRLVEIINLSNAEVNISSGNTVLEVHDGESRIVNQDGFLFYTYSGTHYLFAYKGDDIIVTFPKSYNGEKYVIGDYAFSGKENVISVTLTDGIKTIRNNAFSSCYRIIEVICNGYSGHPIPGREQHGYVAYNAIEVHNEKESKIENIDGYLFYPYIDEDGHMFNYLVGYVGDETRLVLPESYHGETYSIYKYAFYGNNKITSVQIGSNVTYIGDKAFMNCSELTRVTINEGVLFINSYAFSNCKKLTSIYLPNSLHYIENRAFEYCTSLERIDIPNGVYRIGGAAFDGCASLKKVELADSVTQIEAGAFSYCTALQEIYIHSGVKYMGKGVFTGCTNATIGCQDKQKPADWDVNWNESGGTVLWGAILEVPVE